MLKSVTLAATLLSPCAALAQQNCGPTPSVYERLAVDFGEARIGRGLASNGQQVVEVWQNAGTGTWTVLITSANGQSCLAAYGEGWDTTAVIPGVDG